MHAWAKPSTIFCLLAASGKRTYQVCTSQHPQFNVKAKELIFTNAQAVARLQMAGLRSDSRGGIATEAGGERHCCAAGALDLRRRGYSFVLLLPHSFIAFSSKAPEMGADSHRGGCLSHFDPPLLTCNTWLFSNLHSSDTFITFICPFCTSKFFDY